MFNCTVTALSLQVLDDDDDDKVSGAAMDTDSPLPTRAPLRQRQMLDDDSDDEFDQPAAELSAPPHRSTILDESAAVLGAL